ncbi:hypothetical protein DACRYDRAFT_47945 [Dacryopinax primogenitus]|uniref:Putative gamma-glutamylcyclotransferase n=1 Tax=Dacryopinax primogenitus (strain DJM 731) TaxID=1858805 RepID=M5G954_DACPD|nr:uncharacterized protein DACRYDRAFT_47945 [Dacryopinax primogenitus]EJU04710.1 hypothetical protein DACRYDRAFT_47945 [Dacryopinax primogenitus]
MNKDSGDNAFFYGTLMYPKIIKRVLNNTGNHLSVCPAILLDYTRHQVKHADYPGVIPYSQTRRLLDRELPESERCVRGSLVYGLTKEDFSVLDIFEGGVRPLELIPILLT